VWKVIKWLFVLSLVAVCALSIFFNLVLSVGMSTRMAADGIIEEHVSGPVGLAADSKVAIVSVHDIIIGNEWAGPAAWVMRQLERAGEDDKIKAIILDVDSPGGSITACDVIYGRIKALQAAGTNVYVHMRGVAASGGYYVSAPAAHIVAQPTTITGSIGVIVQSFNIQGLFEKIGVEAVVFKSGERKDILSPYRPIEEEEKQILQAITDEMFDRFKKVVMESRKLTDEQMDKVSDGSVVTAARALELGLIDQIGYFEDVEKLALQAEGPKCAVVRYTQPPSLADVLFSSRSPRLTALEGEIDTLTAMLRPGFYYLWPGP
jgi:protease-4